jgi:hypothetical protein
VVEAAVPHRLTSRLINLSVERGRRGGGGLHDGTWDPGAAGLFMLLPVYAAREPP